MFFIANREKKKYCTLMNVFTNLRKRVREWRKKNDGKLHWSEVKLDHFTTIQHNLCSWITPIIYIIKLETLFIEIVLNNTFYVDEKG